MQATYIDEQAETQSLQYCLMNTESLDSFHEDLFTDGRKELFKLMSIVLKREGTLSPAFVSSYIKNTEFTPQDKFFEIHSAYNEVFDSSTLADVASSHFFSIDATRALLNSYHSSRSFYDELAKIAFNNAMTPQEALMKLDKWSVSPTKYTAENFYEKYEKFKLHADNDLLEIGVPSIDVEQWFIKGNITCIGGNTGSMKTTFSLWVAIRYLYHNEDKTAMFLEKEMPIDDIVRKIVAMVTSIPVQEVFKDKAVALESFEKHNSDKLQSILSRLKLVDTNEFASFNDIVGYVETCKPDLFVIDFITQLEDASDGTSEFNFSIMKGIHKIKRLVQRTKTCCIAICQLKKGTVEQRVSKIPWLDDIEWSGTVKQLAANVVFTFFPKTHYPELPDDQKKFFFAYPQKTRFGTCNPVALLANPANNQFTAKDAHMAQKWLQGYITRTARSRFNE